MFQVFELDGQGGGADHRNAATQEQGSGLKPAERPAKAVLRGVYVFTGFSLNQRLRIAQLPENWTDTRETIVEGMTFNLHHLGMTLVDQPKGEDLSAAAVKRIVATAKASGKKPQKVALKVSPQGIELYDSLSNKLQESVSIYRISYCTVDKLHDKVFAYIAQNTLNGTLECHAYLCSKRKVAQAVALTVAQAFTVAFELWQVAKEEKGKRVKSGSAGEASSSSHSERSNSLGSLKGTDVATDNLLDFEDSVNVAVETNGNIEEDQWDNHRPPETNNNPAWEIEDGLDEAFGSCALDSYGSLPDWQCRVLTPRSWTLG
ncbi:low density lipoprotein receptor adapter protein 1a isoform X3 [Scophthalmus maximus]|uniref:low density lipoprotein receptor adapter protein 1a isoform X3 n=1 Tax=Scophthalmus maximus TaxID=52904 RepID=UPI001FA93D89|nr:low density lipoprotein receptor adapter protein 1a isoform X3 [Scophthalmus maximus]